MPRQKSTPRKLDDASWTHVVFGMKRLRRAAKVVPTSEPAPPPQQSHCTHCYAEIAPDAGFRGYCGLDCAGDDGYLKGF
jgi:hypothetical protein